MEVIAQTQDKVDKPVNPRRTYFYRRNRALRIMAELQGKAVA